MGLTIEQLGLGPLAGHAALELVNQFGPETIRFTRGHSDLRGQARAMAGNVMRNKEWIKQTYTRRERPSYPVACQLQEAVYRNIHVEDRAGIAAYLFECLRALPDGGDISFHTKTLDGAPAAEAFDLTPLEGQEGTRTPIGNEVAAFIERHRIAWHLDAFLQREGGLRIWHLQFLAPVPDPVT